MILSKNKIKFLASLKLKKFRDEYGQFIAEGDKIIRDVLKNNNPGIRLLVATGDWLNENRDITGLIKETYEANSDVLGKISSFGTAPPAIALFDIPRYNPDHDEIKNSLSVGLDTIQDPGNLGTIIRTADWFGISNIFCNQGCADIYNPKTIQSSMGAVFNLKIHYVDLKEFLGLFAEYSDYQIIGTYMQGEPVYNVTDISKGILIFGNEARGITGDYGGLIKRKLTIPPARTDGTHVESLNVASAAAVVLSRITLNNSYINQKKQFS